MTRTDVLLALIRDHVANRHQRRPAPACPVCAHVRGQTHVPPRGADWVAHEVAEDCTLYIVGQIVQR